MFGSSAVALKPAMGKLRPLSVSQAPGLGQVGARTLTPARNTVGCQHFGLTDSPVELSWLLQQGA